jgi:AhpC/TSA family
MVLGLVAWRRQGGSRERNGPMMTPPVFHTLEDAFRFCRDMNASLREWLDTFSNAVRALHPDLQEAVDRLVERLMATDAGAAAPQVGELMPTFILPNESAELVSLKRLLRVGPVAITFHRGHWCPYCRINTKALAEAQTEIAGAGAQIVAIMTDRQQFAAALKHEAKAHYPMLADMDNGEPCHLRRRRAQGPDVGLGSRPCALSGQRGLDAAAPGEFRRRYGWLC